MSIPDTKSQKVTSISYKLSSVAHRPCLLVNCGDLLLYRYLYYSALVTILLEKTV